MQSQVKHTINLSQEEWDNATAADIAHLTVGDTWQTVTASTREEGSQTLHQPDRHTMQQLRSIMATTFSLNIIRQDSGTPQPDEQSTAGDPPQAKTAGSRPPDRPDEHKRAQARERIRNGTDIQGDSYRAEWGKEPPALWVDLP